MRYDAVVVGGGPAGCVAAARLSEDPARTVCLLEAGPDFGPYAAGRWPEPLLDGREVTLDYAWPSSDPDRTKTRPRVIGGGSSLNACNLALGAPPDYEWGDGWTAAALTPYADRACELLCARRIVDRELGGWHRRLLDAARAAGLDAETHLVNKRGDVRWNAAFAYLDPARDRPNLTIRADEAATRLDPPSVLLAGGERVEARLIVLAAGAYGTPALLLTSGLGTGVGAGLADHPGVALRYASAESVRGPTTMSQVGIRHRTSRSPDEHWDLRIYSAEDGVERVVLVFSMTPSSRGSVTVADEELHVDHGFVAEDDVARLAEGIELVREILGPEEVPGPETDLGDYIRANVRGFFHPVATCAMGPVVDMHGGVRGVDGVAVCDAAAIPVLPRAPTHLTVLAVAERIVERLRDS